MTGEKNILSALKKGAILQDAPGYIYGLHRKTKKILRQDNNDPEYFKIIPLSRVKDDVPCSFYPYIEDGEVIKLSYYSPEEKTTIEIYGLVSINDPKEGFIKITSIKQDDKEVCSKNIFLPNLAHNYFQLYSFTRQKEASSKTLTAFKEFIS